MTKEKGSKSSKKSSKKSRHDGHHGHPRFDPTDMLKQLKKEVKALKLETKKIHTDTKEEEEVLEKEKEHHQKSNSIESQLEAIKGKELVKLSHLKHIGFDEVVIKDHLESETKRLLKESTEKQEQRKNTEENIKKMKEMNLQSELAVNAAENDVKKKIGVAQKLKAELDEAELILYIIEKKVRHTRNMKGVDFTKKDSLKQGIKEIVLHIKKYCEDRDTVKKVMKVGARCIALDEEMTSEGKGKDDISIGSVEISEASSDEDN